VKLEAGILGEPCLDFGRFVGAVVVDDEMQVEMLFDGAIGALQEADELLGTVARQAFADDEAGLHIEDGKQCGRAVALGIVRHRCRPAAFHRQARLGAVQGLRA
jgi:hypothetical protein